MTAATIALLVVFLGIVLICVKPLGLYMAHVMAGTPIWPLRAGAPLERLIYRSAGVNPAAEMDWKHYAIALLLFNTLGALALYALQRLQAWLPLNPQRFANVSADSSFNTALSFITNTNWQGYSGESTMSYLTQMAGLAVQNFMSAATGIVVAFALIRGLARHSSSTIGNFWVDLTRSTLYVLLPFAAVLALVLASQGVVQSFSAYKDVTTVETLTYQQPKVDAQGNADQGRRRQPGAGDGHHPYADAADGSDGLPGEHQGAGHQRRRLHERQFGASLRESERVHQFPGDAGDPADPGGADLHLRPHGGRHPPGLGGTGGDADPAGTAAGPGGVQRTARQSADRPAGRGPDRQLRCSPAATWRARRRASASAPRRCLPRWPPRPPPARSIPCTIRITPAGRLRAAVPDAAG